MATSIKKSAAKPVVEAKCVCGHLESQHGSTGTRPCLETVGNLLNPDFCPCDEFRPKVARAA